MNWKFSLLSIASALGCLFYAGTSVADCTTPAGVEGEIIYNSTEKVVQFCNGTNWINTGQAGSGGGGGGGFTACTPGDTIGSGICAGSIGGKNLVVAPAGCAVSASSAGSCTGSDLTRVFMINGMYVASSLYSDGALASAALLSMSTSTDRSAGYCDSLSLDSASWHLPSVAEMQIVFANKSAISSAGEGLTAGDYWVAAESGPNSAFYVAFGATDTIFATGNSDWVAKNVRCVRRTTDAS